MGPTGTGCRRQGCLGRLRRKEDVARVLRWGRRGSSPLVSVRAVRGDEPGVRVAFAIGRRVGRSVTRNRIRRRVREALRAELAGVLPGVDLVASASPACRDVPFLVLRQEVRAALKKAGAWTDPEERP